jgi:hypothetical protein
MNIKKRLTVDGLMDSQVPGRQNKTKEHIVANHRRAPPP